MDVTKFKSPETDAKKDFKPQLYNHVGDVLLYKYLVPNDLSVYRVAEDLHIKVSRLQHVIHKRTRLTADVAVRLAKYFELSPSHFLTIQAMFEGDEKNLQLSEELNMIPTYIESKIERGVYNPE